MSGNPKLIAAAALIVGGYIFYLAINQPSYFTNIRFLGGLIALELLLACIWEFRACFFPLLILVFVWAGIWAPLADQWQTGRWIVLVVGAIAGCFVFLKQRDQHFRPIHLVALCCVSTAVVSALVSPSPLVALLKSTSLLFLFVYAASGARLAIVGREKAFFRGLLLGCEVVVYLSAIFYFLLLWPFWGNPNSLGLVMSVVIIPILLWGFFVSERRMERYRRGFALSLAFLLLLNSYERAGLAAAGVACLLFCVGLRKYRLLLKGTAFVLVGAAFVAASVPLENTSSEITASNSFVARFVYKGKPEAGLLGSRKTVWEQTLTTLREHPWFGTGFGTTNSGYDGTNVSMTSSAEALTQEDGNSYLAITQWTGMLGVVPFLLLIIFVCVSIGRVFLYMRRTGNACYAVPIAGVLAAGLMNAVFEDWLFAVGYYTCVFFWALAFVLPDLIAAMPMQGHQYFYLPDFHDRRTAPATLFSGPHVPMQAD
jgi:O-antigen ligase